MQKYYFPTNRTKTQFLILKFNLKRAFGPQRPISCFCSNFPYFTDICGPELVNLNNFGLPGPGLEAFNRAKVLKIQQQHGT